MKLAGLITHDLVIPHLLAENKDECLRELASTVTRVHADLNVDEVTGALLEREHLCSTGIGSGIAIPHARLATLSSHVVAFARSLTGIEFNAVDDKPVELLFVVLSSSNLNQFHLKLLARISKMLHDTSFREVLLRAESREALLSAILDKDEQY